MTTSTERFRVTVSEDENCGEDMRRTPHNSRQIGKLQLLLATLVNQAARKGAYGKATLTFDFVDGTIKNLEDELKNKHK